MLVYWEHLFTANRVKGAHIAASPGDWDKGLNLMTVHQHVCREAADSGEFSMIISPLSAAVLIVWHHFLNLFPVILLKML